MEKKNKANVLETFPWIILSSDSEMHGMELNF